MGGSAGKNKSSSNANTRYQDDVWGTSGDALKGLYDQASNLYGSQGGYGQQMQDKAGALDPYNQQIMDNTMRGTQGMLGGGSYGDTNQIRNQLMDSLNQTTGGSQTGKMYESIVGGKGNTYIDPMVNAMKASSMENLNRMNNSIGMDAAAAGQSGSSRHAMQNAMQSREMNNDMLDREMNMRGGAYDTDLQMKMGIAQQADQGIQGSQDRLLSMLQGADQNVQTGMGMGQNQQNLGMGSMAPWMQANQAPWNSMQNYSNILGGPTILGSGSGSQSGNSKGVGGSASIKG